MLFRSGIIIFVIITVVNFLVIARGSARVSEVAARFALDALPGKQATIDSDLRGGLISNQQAQQQQVQGQQQDPENPEEGQDLDSAMAQLGEALGKSEKVSSSARRKLMSKLNKAKKNILTQYEKDSREAVSKISEILENKCSHDEE